MSPFLRKASNLTAWVDSNLMYRRGIVVENSQGTVSVDEDILVEIDTSTLISNGKMQNNCQDLRFADSDDSTLLEYWIESGCNTSSTKIWVRIPSLPSSGKTIYMYYGNASASKESLDWSGNLTLFFEGSCPTGWTQNTDLTDLFLYGSDTYGSIGGTSSHGHSSVSCTSSSIAGSTIGLGGTGVFGSSNTHTHTSLSAGISDASIIPPYLNLVACQSSSFTYPTDAIAYFETTFASGWNTYSNATDKFIVPSTTSGGTGGHSSHTHSTTVGTETGNASGSITASGVDFGDGADGDITVSVNTNINTINSISGRSCSQGGDAVNYSVTSLSSTSAVVTPTPATGCLAAGDEILLINLQGTTSYYGNVGKYEILEISSISGSTVYFTSSKVNAYGNTGDTNIGTARTNQRVMLQRVPNYNDVTVNASANFYPSSWDGVKGGVLFFKANGSVTINGVILGNSRGYAGGTGGSSDRLVGGYSGESYRGVSLGYGGGTSVSATVGGGRYEGRSGDPLNGYIHGGGGGGGASGNAGTDCGEDVRVEAGGSGGGGGYAGGGGGGTGARGWGVSIGREGGSGGDVGVSGGGGSGSATNVAVSGGNAGFAGGTAVGVGGIAGSGTTSASGGGGALRGAAGGAGGGGGGYYGTADLSFLYLGSGGGGGGGGAISCATSHQNGYNGGAGGAIIGIYANSLTVSGNILSDGATAESRESTASGGAGGGGAGGSIKLYANVLSIGTSKVSVTGGLGSLDAGSITIRPGGAGGVGRIALYYLTSLSGTTTNTGTTQTYDLNNSYVPLNHTHTVNSAIVSTVSNMPSYYSLLVGKASGEQYANHNSVVVMNSLPPLGWQRYTNLDGKFVLGSTTSGSNGGSANHTHTVGISTGYASVTATSTASGSNLGILDHTHSCSTSSNSVSNLPPYVSVIYAQRNVSESVQLQSEEMYNYSPQTPDLLLTEGAENPTQMLILDPTFSAIFSDQDITQKGKYYQIQVSTLDDFSGNIVWDSGKLEFDTPIENGDRISNITYAGSTLSWSTTYYWRIKLWDDFEIYNSGSEWSLPSSFSTLSDEIAPTGSVTINSGDVFTQNSTMNLNMSSTDQSPTLGVTEMIVCDDSGFSGCNWEEYSDTKSFSFVSEEGTKTIYVKFKDGIGNESITYSDDIVLDHTSPVGSVGINEGNLTVNEINVDLNISASDITSGVSEMMVCNSFIFSGCDWEDYSTTKSWSLVEGDGNKIVYIKFRDNAGNESTSSSASIILDTISPVGSLLINEDSLNTKEEIVNLSISSTDSTAGLHQMMICNSDDFSSCTWEDYSESKQWPLTTGDGEKNVYVKFKDYANNESLVYSDSVNLDTTPPVGSVVVNSGASTTIEKNVNLLISSTDITSGLYQMMICNSDDFSSCTWEDYSVSKQWLLTIGDGGKSVYVKFKDNANNESLVYSDSIILDTTSPVGSIFINSGATVTAENTVNLTISSTDILSNVSQMMICNDPQFSGCVWETYSISKVWQLSKGDGEKSVYIKFKDSVGLVSQVFKDTIKLETPVVAIPSVEIVEEEVDDEVVDEVIVSEPPIGEVLTIEKYVLTILDKDKNPVGGAYVKLETGEEGYTNEEGVIEFANIQKGKQKANVSYGNYQIDFEFDVLGESIEVSHSVVVSNLTVLKEEEENNNWIYILFGVLVVLIGVFGIYKYRKYKLDK